MEVFNISAHPITRNQSKLFYQNYRLKYLEIPTLKWYRAYTVHNTLIPFWNFPKSTPIPQKQYYVAILRDDNNSYELFVVEIEGFQFKENYTFASFNATEAGQMVWDTRCYICLNIMSDSSYSTTANKYFFTLFYLYLFYSTLFLTIAKLDFLTLLIGLNVYTNTRYFSRKFCKFNATMFVSRMINMIKLER